MTDFLRELESTRADYKTEGSWHRLLLDAYRGTGGFQGATKQPAAGFWGSAAEAYAPFASYTKDQAYGQDSYLDRYQREDTDKFNRRVQVSHYLNYVKPITNLKVSHIERKPHKRNNVPDELQKWIEKTGWDKGSRRRALVTAVLGYWLAFVDKPAAGSANMDPYVVMFFPCNMLAYNEDDRGVMNWMKFCVTYCEQESWRADPVEVKRYTIVTREEFYVYEVRGESIKNGPQGKHSGLGTVPVVSWRADANVEDSVKADSINAELVPEVRRLFNLGSELDENLRANAFSLLIVPREPVGEGEGGGAPKEVGAENALSITPEQTNKPFYLEPPGDVAATYETRIEKTIVEIFRMARVEYAKAEGTRTSAQSKDSNFKQTNLAIVDLASSLAKAERETLIQVGRAMGINEEKLQAIECVPHESYDEEELNDEIEQVISAVTELAIGKTAKAELIKRLLGRLLKGIGADKWKAIESEVEDALDQAEKDAELMRKQATEAPGDNASGNDPNEDSEQPQAAE